MIEQSHALKWTLYIVKQKISERKKKVICAYIIHGFQALLQPKHHCGEEVAYAMDFSAFFEASL